VNKKTISAFILCTILSFLQPSIYCYTTIKDGNCTIMSKKEEKGRKIVFLYIGSAIGAVTVVAGQAYLIALATHLLYKKFKAQAS